MKKYYTIKTSLIFSKLKILKYDFHKKKIVLLFDYIFEAKFVIKIL